MTVPVGLVIVTIICWVIAALSIVWFTIEFSGLKTCEKREGYSCPEYGCQNDYPTGANFDCGSAPYRIGKDGKAVCQSYASEGGLPKTKFVPLT